MSKLIISIILLLGSVCAKAQKSQSGSVSVIDLIRFVDYKTPSSNVDGIGEELKAKGYNLIVNEDDEILYGKNVKNDMTPASDNACAVELYGLKPYGNGKFSTSCYIWTYSKKDFKSLINEASRLGKKDEAFDCYHINGYQLIYGKDEGHYYIGISGVAIDS